MIQLLQSEGRTGPTIYCDICNTRIEDASDAAVVFQAGYKEGAELDFRHVHKGACDAEAQRRAGGHLSWQPLEDHLLYLIGNVGLSTKKLQKVGAIIEERGF